MRKIINKIMKAKVIILIEKIGLKVITCGADTKSWHVKAAFNFVNVVRAKRNQYVKDVVDACPGSKKKLLVVAAWNG
jgi:GTP:adenosylcobinamide-phosphate guanylyltransferase